MSSSTTKQQHSRERPRGTPKSVPDPPMWDEPEEFVTQRALAGELKISTRQVRELEAHGLPSEGTGRNKRYPAWDCDAWYFHWRQLIQANPHGYRGHVSIEAARAAKEDHSALSRAFYRLHREDADAKPLDWYAREFLDKAARLRARGGHPMHLIPPGYSWD